MLRQRLRQILEGLAYSGRAHEDQKVLMGQILTNQLRARGPLPSIQDAEFRVFSQFGEDGILQYLIERTGVPKAAETFVEFGVASFDEANCRFVLLKDNWRGLIIDGSKRNMDKVRADQIHWRHGLTVRDAFIDRDNIQDLILGSGISGEIGILSVDIDGNDYWVWERINCVDPIIVVAEYNSTFGPDAPISVPYDPAFQRTAAHHSNLYWGASIGALTHQANTRGYALVGGNRAGNNVFFVRRDRLGDLKELRPQQAWEAAKFRESRDANGGLTYLEGAARLEAIQHLPVVDVTTGETRPLSSFGALL